MKKLLILTVLISSPVFAECQITWDDPANADWIEGIRLYRDGVEVGTGPVLGPVACADVGVTPCATCVYTARFYRVADESADSSPLAVSLPIPLFPTANLGMD